MYRASRHRNVMIETEAASDIEGAQFSKPLAKGIYGVGAIARLTLFVITD